MGCTASRHLGKPAFMEGCPSPRAAAYPQHASTHSTDYSVEYHRHFVALTSSSYGLLKVASPSKPVEPNNCDKSRIGSLNEMYGKLRSLESSETANISPWPCERLNSPSGGDLSHSPSAHHAWCIDSAEFVITETVNVRELMMGFEEEALPQGTPPVRQASGIGVSPAQRGALVSRQPKTKPFHTMEEVNVLKKPAKASQNALDEEEYESGKENSLPEQGKHSMLAPPRRCPLMNTSLSQTLKVKEACERNVSSIIKSSSKTSVPPSTVGAVQNATSKRGKEEHALHSRQHQRKRSAAAFAPLVVSSTTSMSRRVVVRESSLSSDPSSPLFDPDMVASYEKALKTISEDSWNACLVSPEVDCRRTLTSTHGDKKLLDIGNLEPPEDADLKTHNVLERFEEKCPPGGDTTVVLYTTTLRGIKKTFEDCNTIRSILQSYGLSIDERDVSMHLEFLNELRKLMDRVVCVPRLFIKGRYIGGVEEVAKLHENGELNELVEGLPREANAGICDGCDGIRFVPCLECRGSCKVRLEDDKVQRCPDCNENGLIQCPICT